MQEPIQVMPSALYTLGGVRIDPWCRCNVPGLFVGGEAAGGVHGANRLGGSSMPDIQVFGRRAGIAAAEDARQYAGGGAAQLDKARARAAALETYMGRADGVRPPDVKKRIQKLMWDHVGLVRSGPKLTETLTAFRNLREHVLPTVKVTNKSRVLNREWMEALELENLLDIGEAMAASSLQRHETRGAHYRTDFPDTDPNWTANLIVRRDADGLHVEKKAVVTLETSAPAHKKIGAIA
jgi:succinate dehydrogenase/fumarate reductase flavoprotein subunit